MKWEEGRGTEKKYSSINTREKEKMKAKSHKSSTKVTKKSRPILLHMQIY